MVSRTSASSGSGSCPWSIHRKLAACERPGSGGITSRPVRTRSKVAIKVGVSAISRIALRYSASGDSSQPSGSNAEEADTEVRSIDIGDVFCASVGIILARNGWSSRSRTKNRFNVSSSALVGSSRLWRR